MAVLLLKKLGVRMDLAENGSVALEHLMARPYDLVLMDCHMPEMNGYEAAAEVRRREGPNRNVPIVAVTADVASGSRERALDSGMNDFIGKPIHVSELERVLRTWIRPERQPAALADGRRRPSSSTRWPGLERPGSGTLRAQGASDQLRWRGRHASRPHRR